MAQVVADEQVAASGMIAEAPNPEVADYRDLSLPLRMDRGRPRAAGSPPRPGEHTLEILAETGLDEDEIAALLEDGVAEAFQGLPSKG